MKRFFAIENPYGLTTLNQGNQPNRLHAFTSVSARDVWVANDPEHRASITSSTNLVRRMLRTASDYWETVVAYSHSAIPYLDR